MRATQLTSSHIPTSSQSAKKFSGLTYSEITFSELLISIFRFESCADENGMIIIVNDEHNNISWAGLYKPINDEIRIKKNAYDIESVLYHEISPFSIL